ncbi:MAG TPA: PEGA domain-containing protein, partial [Vicinamibacterales bacterium]
VVKKEAAMARRQLEDEKRQRELLREQQEADLRRAAEEEAARAFEAEAARVRAEAEARLREETERAREEANSRLESEVAAIKADAEHRRSSELEEVRAQVLRLRTAAAEQARVAAEQAVATEVARAKSLAPVPQAPKDIENQWSDTFVADERRPQRSFEPVPSHRRTWLIAAGVAIVALIGSVFAFGVIPLGKSSSKPSTSVVNKEPETGPTADAPWVDSTKSGAASGPGGELQVESTPAGARVLLDGKESGFTPLTLKDVPAGRHALVLEGESGTVRRTVRVQTGERTVARYEITAGFLSVFSRIPVEIYQGSRKIGVSGDKSILLAPGQYKVSLVNTHFRYSADAEFTIRPGEVTTHTVELPTGLLSVNTASGAEILVEGEKVGVAPIAPIPIPIGTREIIVRHPQLGERRQSVEVLAGNKPVELSVIFEGAAAPRTPPKLAPLTMPVPERRSR